MEDLLREILQAVRRRGWSARQASMKAVGTPELIRDMRRGRVPSVERFRALCKVLGLEFYVGPPRSESPPDPERLERAIKFAEEMNERSPNRLTRAERARIASSAYALMSEEVGDKTRTGRLTRDGIISKESTDPLEPSTPILDQGMRIRRTRDGITIEVSTSPLEPLAPIVDPGVRIRRTRDGIIGKRLTDPLDPLTSIVDAPGRLHEGLVVMRSAESPETLDPLTPAVDAPGRLHERLVVTRPAEPPEPLKSPVPTERIVDPSTPDPGVGPSQRRS